jgi:hypothetical protein
MIRVRVGAMPSTPVAPLESAESNRLCSAGGNAPAAVLRGRHWDAEPLQPQRSPMTCCRFRCIRLSRRGPDGLAPACGRSVRRANIVPGRLSHLGCDNRRSLSLRPPPSARIPGAMNERSAPPWTGSAPTGTNPASRLRREGRVSWSPPDTCGQGASAGVRETPDCHRGIEPSPHPTKRASTPRRPSYHIASACRERRLDFDAV